MDKVRPVYVKWLIAAIALYVAATSIMIAELYVKTIRAEHILMHVTGKH